MPAGPRLHSTEVDGVRTLWSDLGGPLRAGLVVRVGYADESFTTAGVTHLLEHLALHETGLPGDHANGRTGPTTMDLHVEGDEQEVVRLLAGITRSLADPPADRCALELEVLRAEQAQRDGTLAEELLARRYGAAGYGLAGADEPGLARLAIDDVRSWARTHVTTGAATLWLSGPPPAGLRLHLPAGPAVPTPDPRRDLLPGGRLWDHGADRSAGLHTVLGRGPANEALAALLRHRLLDTLRLRRGLAYAPEAGLLPVTADTDWLIGLTDLLPGRESDGCRAFVAAVDALADGDGVAGRDLEDWRTTAARRDTDPVHALLLLRSAAGEVTLGRQPDQPADLAGARAAQRSVVTVTDVVTAAREARDEALLLVPRGVQVTASSWSPVSSPAAKPVQGRTHSHVEAPEVDAELVVGGDGLTMSIAGRPRVTVRVAETAGVLCWPDGRRTVVHQDGSGVVVEPRLWRSGAAVVEHVDRTWPEHLRLEQPARAADAVPTPRATAPRRLPPRRPALTVERISGAVVGGFLALAAVRSVVEGHWLLTVVLGAVLLGAGVAAHGFRDVLR